MDSTRYDKHAANFLAMIQLASMRLWLRAYYLPSGMRLRVLIQAGATPKT